jgi:hypothetical protein
MRLANLPKSVRRHRAVVGVAALVAAMSGCGLNEVNVPSLVGPAEGGLSLQMTASPDRVNADGVSQSLVRIQARNQNGDPAANRQLFVTLGGSADGFLVAGSVLVGELNNGMSLMTDSNGVAQVVYLAGFRGGTLAQIRVQPFGSDATADPALVEKVVYILQI